MEVQKNMRIMITRPGVMLHKKTNSMFSLSLHIPPWIAAAHDLFN